MRFIVDAQLPPALARSLSESGHETWHVIDLDMAAADDSAIWDRALTVGAAIFTKDEDFALRVAMTVTGPPIVWLRLGNTRKQALLNRVDVLMPTIVDALMDGERLIEIV